METIKKYQHVHIRTLFCQVLECTNKGFKVLQKDSKGLTKKERTGKIAFYDLDNFGEYGTPGIIWESIPSNTNI